MKKMLLIFLMLPFVYVSAQTETDTTTILEKKFNYKALVIPSALIAYGFVGLESHQLLDFNNQIHSEVTEDIDERITIDDFAQYAPAVSVYGLNAFGIEGKHNLKDRTVIMASSVMALKSVSKVERPDGTSNNSFPSGHTATAFAGAEFLWQEYKDQSIWYGISGYAVATGTGLFRMYNNRHWLTDVAAGAGIGILSTKIAYWIHPYVDNLIFGKKEHKTAAAFMPCYNGKQMGCGFALSF